MAYEIMNGGQATPHRVHALLRLVPRLEQPTKGSLGKLLQPQEIDERQDAFQRTFDAADKCGFLTQESDGTVRLLVAPEAVESVDGFRRVARSKLLGVTDNTLPNYLFNLYSAWYAVQDERVVEYDPPELVRRFNSELYPDAAAGERALNETKQRAWLSWAAFLGSGWLLNVSGRRESLAPDPTVRLRAQVAETLPADGTRQSLRHFLQQLRLSSPDLDGGLLYDYCWQASRGSEQRGTNLSLMLSTALRCLHDEGTIKLEREADASEIWGLYPAIGHAVRREITHLRLREHTREP